MGEKSYATDGHDSSRSGIPSGSDSSKSLKDVHLRSRTSPLRRR
jgi:hypothetical protein